MLENSYLHGNRLFYQNLCHKSLETPYLFCDNSSLTVFVRLYTRTSLILGECLKVQTTMHKVKMERAFTRTSLALGKASSLRAAGVYILVHDCCEKVQTTMHKVKMERVKSGCSTMVVPQLPKLMAWVRFPSPAPLLIHKQSWRNRYGKYDSNHERT